MKKTVVFLATLSLTLYIFSFLLVCARIFKGIFINDFSGLVWNFVVLFLIITAFSGIIIKLYRKKVFVVFKDEDW